MQARECDVWCVHMVCVCVCVSVLCAGTCECVVWCVHVGCVCVCECVGVALCAPVCVPPDVWECSL